MTAPYTPKPSILDRVLSRLIPTDQYGDLLSPTDRSSIQRQGLLGLGAGILSQSGPGSGPLQAFGKAYQGLNVNEMADHALKLQAYQRKLGEQAAVAQVLAKHPASAGDDPYTRLAAIANDLAGMPGTEDLVGKLAGVLSAIKPHAPTNAERARWSFQTVMEGDKPVLYRINEDTGTKYRVGIAKEGGGAKKGVSQQKAGALLRLAENALPTLQAAKPPSIVETLAAHMPLGLGQGALSEERQLSNQAGTQFSDAILRFTSGANTPEAEVQRYLGFITPRTGDKPAVIQRKISAQKAIIAALRTAAGKGDIDPDEAVGLIQSGANAIGGVEETVPDRFAP